jgi:hypothetical protein
MRDQAQGIDMLACINVIGIEDVVDNLLYELRDRYNCEDINYWLSWVYRCTNLPVQLSNAAQVLRVRVLGLGRDILEWYRGAVISRILTFILTV